MKTHEYQGNEILREYGAAVPKGKACFSVDEAVTAAGQAHGAAGAIIVGGKGTADEKIAALEAAGVNVTRNPSDMGQLMREALQE